MRRSRLEFFNDYGLLQTWTNPCKTYPILHPGIVYIHDVYRGYLVAVAIFSLQRSIYKV